MFFWVFLVEELEKRVVMFGISALKFAKCKKIVQTKKKNNFRTKNALFGYFRL